MPETSHAVSRGGTSFWVQGPETLDSDVLAREALSHGIVLEPGSTFFASKKPPRNYFRLGFSAIEVDKIDQGIKMLSELIKEQI
jgi:GntR family transcriptional regulator/MocR family aminotransferase